MKILVSGLGSIGRWHALTLADLGEDVEVYGYDPSPDAARGWEHGKHFRDIYRGQFREALEAVKPQGVVLASPPAAHFGQVQTAIQAGINAVFVEKPLCVTQLEAVQLVGLAEDRGVVLQVGYQLRFSPELLALYTTIQNAKGRPYYVEAWFGFRWDRWRPGGGGEYFWRRDEGGGILLEASHDLDLLLWLLGMPGRVTAALGSEANATEPVPVETWADLLLWWPQWGCLGHLHLDAICPEYRRGLSLWGTKECRNWSLLDPVQAVPWCLAEMGAFVRAIRHVQDWGGRVENALPPWAATGEDGLSVLRVIEAARTSARSGRVEIVEAP